ncbi:HAD family hydrolase [Amycolatopsis magusensis]|uniref:HAD family hydrolase n=1 Tax=Amycolatopsis magusensis TaxID=882444 RepID=UPI00378DCB95
MTTGDEAKARELLANAKALLLDFDGPICSVFAGLPAPTVAEQLRVVLADGGHTDLPESVATTGDPFDVFRYAATLGDDEARYVETAFTALEVEAIATAEPTPGAHEFMAAWHNTGRPLAIVSNNSKAAIEAYLALYGHRLLVNAVSARSDYRAHLLKPDPYLIEKALLSLETEAPKVVMIGDSPSDIAAAATAGVGSIAYVNKLRKIQGMVSAGADVLVSSLQGIGPELAL